MDINAPINYKFPYVWNQENMSGTPKVNPLLKALIERNYNQANALLLQGATFKGIDHTTLSRCLFEFLEDYTLMKFMTDNGFNEIYFHSYPSISATTNFECIDRPGYGWSLTGRAFMLGKRNVLELLFQNRFEPGQLWKNSKTYDLADYAMRTDHITLIDILLSHGYPRQALLNTILLNRQAESKAYQYVANDPDINWKSYGLGKLEQKIPVPAEPKFSKFMFKKTKEKLTAEYNRRLANYKKEVVAKEKYIKTLSKSDLDAYFRRLKKDPEVEKAMNAVFEEILEEAKQKVLRDIDKKPNRTKTATNNSASSRNGAVNSSYEQDLRETKINQFSFVDCSGSYRRWGDSFIDHKGNWCNWGSGFYDYDDNYIYWGGSYKDSSGAYRRWGDDFVDGIGNFVRVP